MAYDEKLAGRVRNLLAGRKGFDEKKMFGGLCFMLQGKMICGVLKDDLVLRVGAENHKKALARPHVRPMDFTGHPLKGFVFVGPAGCRTEKSLSSWITGAVEYASTLPKNSKRKAARR
ncbi:MAG: TfoX/Sxy family protein [candidate division Zixibacteria bacterium]|nr:TfoX/Sxy family protein [candidate division Zixibacteria bacterium]